MSIEGFVCPGCGKRRAATLKCRPRLHACGSGSPYGAVRSLWSVERRRGVL